jgi:hypothetical protein
LPSISDSLAEERMVVNVHPGRSWFQSTPLDTPVVPLEEF